MKKKLDYFKYFLKITNNQGFFLQIIAVVLGIIYFGQTEDQNGIMNINGALFLLLTNTTFSNMFAVVNVSPLSLIAAHTIYIGPIPSWIFSGLLHGTAHILTRAFQWHVPHGCLLFVQTVGGITPVCHHSDFIRGHFLFHGRNEWRGRPISHCLPRRPARDSSTIYYL